MILYMDWVDGFSQLSSSTWGEILWYLLLSSTGSKMSHRSFIDWGLGHKYQSDYKTTDISRWKWINKFILRIRISILLPKIFNILEVQWFTSQEVQRRF